MRRSVAAETTVAGGIGRLLHSLAAMDPKAFPAFQESLKGDPRSWIDAVTANTAVAGLEMAAAAPVVALVT
jgi:hypothetical protein